MATVLQKKTTHEAEALDNLIEQFKSGHGNQSNLEKLIVTYITQIQELENAWFELIDERTLDTSVGAQLDGIGRIVGEDRLGRNDDDYRQAIRGRIRLNLSRGTAEDIYAIIFAQLGSVVAQITEDSYPAHFEVFFPNTIEVVGASVRSGNLEPFALSHLDVLQVAVDGGALQFITFDAADFANISQASAEEVAAVLDRDVVGGSSTEESDRVLLRSDTIGETSKIQVPGGIANAALGFDTSLFTGWEANQALMVLLSRTIESARGAGIRHILEWNTSSTESFGFLGTPNSLGFTQGRFASAADT